ncbi:MAG TPA: porin [Vicinamibacterales bacterium]|nr:porin [Vicinamibacterales bacterium]
MKRFGIVFAFVVMPVMAWAQGEAKPAPPPPSTYDKIWANFTDWYNDKDNPVVQRVLFTGRFQHDFAIVDADQGEHNESNIRRVRFGPRITFFKNYLFHAELEVNPQERNPFYVRFTDLYVMWQKHPKSVIQVGKQSVPFTQEGATSSKELITIDRSNLVNNIWFTQEYMPGISVSGRAAPWVYRAGVYSSGAANRELGKFNGDYFTLGLVGYDFAKTLGVREAVLTANYLYQHPDVNNTFTKRFEHIGSVHFKLEQPRWGLRTDLSKTAGYLGQSDLWALMLMPYFNATDKLQFVTRYTLVDSDAVNGISLNTYENRVVTARGDRYNEGYLGVNYFFYGHRLKLQSGVQFADMQDRADDGGAYSGTSWTTGIRVGW